MLSSIDLSLLAEQIKSTSLLEWIAVSFGVTDVLLASKNNVLLYRAGIIGILCSGFVLVDAKLYAETLLHDYYIVMSIYGWAVWQNRYASGAPQITRSTAAEPK